MWMGRELNIVDKFVCRFRSGGFSNSVVGAGVYRDKSGNVEEEKVASSTLHFGRSHPRDRLRSCISYCLQVTLYNMLQMTSL